MPIRTLLRVIALSLLPTTRAAQDAPARPPLDEAEWDLARGEFPAARAMLQRWRRENPRASRVNQEQLARYYLLSGRLTTNADSAEDNYLTVAVNHPTSRYASEALLRLAQARYARGDTTQAVTYLRRLINDYPSTDFRTMGAVWLVRIESTRGGSNVLMCDLLRSVDRGTNPEVIENLKLEADRVCSARSVASRAAPSTPPPVTTPRRAPSDTPRVAPTKPDTATQVAVEDTAPTRPPPARTTPSAPVAAPADIVGGRVSVQVGAFRELEGARDVQTQLENAGLTDVRLVRTPGSSLIRVRIGRFTNRAGAEQLLARLAALDVSAVLVIDADKEERVR
ncbi:MAG TPA: SPOR domain-containing protein [Longimicrobiales bacterium]